MRWAAALGVAGLLATSACTANVKPQGADNGGASGTAELLVGGDNGSPTFVRNFNPFSPNKRNLTTYMYEPLEVVNSLDGTATPFLATGLSQPDARTVVFHIRQGVQWSDGQPFTPADVAYTFDLVKRTPALDALGVWQHIDSLSVSGADVVFRLKSDDVPAALVLAQQLIVPQHVWKDVQDPASWTNDNPVVTGPYTLADFTPNQYVLAKNPTYWQAGKVAADRIVAPAANSSLDIVSKGYDWAYTFLSDIDNTWVKADRQHNSYWFPPGGTVALYPNLTKAPFDNLDFRRGLSLALDRDKIADRAEQGYVKAAGQTGLLLPNFASWTNPAIPAQGKVAQDTQQALASFAKAGYHQQDGKLVDAGGKQLTLTITTPNGWTDWLQGVQVVQQQLSALGIQVVLNQPQAAAYQQAMQNGDFDLVMGSFGGSGSLFQDYNNLLNSDFKKPVGTSTSANYERYGDPAADTLLAEFKATTDPAKQKEIVNRLQQVVYDQLPAISLFYGGLWGLSSTKKFTGWPSEANPYASLMTWGSTPLLVVTRLQRAH
ncbi:ABC transporter substrate-binding protein [Amycolatopsis rhizosphaerae]|uniref:ABC transporter substrate-binding protein n=2 Tax=Amycolatopsis rhizosphaerae TaxID=2053003 RepID=A0A558BAD7_9PSEU|nr:ABC transporter substrate-binding protein [Amycolatopsis rhizosphaerae]